MLLYTDARFLEHDTGRHPECAARLHSILARLHQARLIDQCAQQPVQSLPVENINVVHDASVAAQAKCVADNGGGFLDADTVVSPRSYEVALLAAGACVSAVDQVLRATDSRALCLVRPPG